jgi:hypothetical protein
MFKKIYVAITLSCLSLTALGATVSELKDQIIHINAQIKKVQLSWGRADLTLKLAQNVNLVLFHEAQSDAKDILARETIIDKIDEMIEQQIDAITNDNKQYEAINFLTVYFPNLLPVIQETDSQVQKDAKKYLSSVIAALANREFRSLLGKQLVNKEKKLIKAMKRAAKREDAQLLN